MKDPGLEGRSRSRKIVMLRMGSQVNDKTLADLRREVQIAARTGDTSVVVDLQAVRHMTLEGVEQLHQVVTESLPPKRVVLFNVSTEIDRLLEDMAIKDQYDAVVARTDTQSGTVEAVQPARPTPAPAAAPARPTPKQVFTPATPPPPPPTPKIHKPKPQGVDPAGLAGKSFLGMEIGEEIGRGGLATVYIAKQSGTHMNVALKVLHPWYSNSKQIVDQFLAEGNLGRRLDHENLVKVYGCGHHGKLYYVMLEYVPSVSVLEMISERGAIPEPTALAVVADVASALEYLEGNAVLHGDVKPGNILVQENGRAKLCDFGQATTLELDPDLGLAPENFGTPGYTAPERAEGGKTSDPRGEIYSLGITLYRMVAGLKPGVSGKIPLQPLHPQFLSDQAISPTVRYFISRMTVLDVRLRYSGAKEALKEIRKHLIGGKEYKRDMQLFGEEYVEAYRRYMREHGTRRHEKKPGGEPPK